MSRKSYGYGAYRGQSGSSRALKVIALVLLAVLILAVGAFFYLQRFMVYGDDGTARLEIPFLQQESPPPSAVPSQPVPVTVAPSPTPAPRLEQEKVRPVSLERQALYDGTAAQAVTEAGANAALFDMKWDTGELGWVSEQTLAIEAKASAGDPAINVAAKTAAEDDGVYRVARISCFKDALLATENTELAILTNSGYRWVDPENVRWTSPTSEPVRAYLTALCKELAGLGFDEILLDNAGYPTEGHLGYIKKGPLYDAGEFERVVSGFYAQAAEALKGTGVRLSVVWDSDASALSGQTEAGIRAAGAAPVIRGADGSYLWPAAAAGALIPAAGEAAPSGAGPGAEF